jgi:hypothetical protein
VTVSYCGNFWDLTCSFLLPNIYMIMQCSLLLEVRNVLVIFSIMATSWDLTHAPILCTNYKWFLPLVYSFMESWNHSGIRQVTGMQTQVCSVVRNFHLGSPPPHYLFVSMHKLISLFSCTSGYHTQDEVDMFAINQTIYHWGLSAWCGMDMSWLVSHVVWLRTTLDCPWPFTLVSTLCLGAYSQYTICCLIKLACTYIHFFLTCIEITLGTGLETCVMVSLSS